MRHKEHFYAAFSWTSEAERAHGGRRGWNQNTRQAIIIIIIIIIMIIFFSLLAHLEASVSVEEQDSRPSHNLRETHHLLH